VKDWQIMILIVVIVVSVFVLVGVGASAYSRRCCERLAENIGRDTRYVSGTCRVEVCDGVWLGEYEVVYQLDLIQSCETPAPQEQDG